MTTRTETDSLGPVEVPGERLWGAQTQRSFLNFRISSERMPLRVIHALTLVKKAAALTNVELGRLDPTIGDAIARAADEVLTGMHDEEFPLSVWQTGSGTQSNMNVNEVLANRASELMGGPRGNARLVHPNDHVNQGQSSNDVFPTAMSIAAAATLEREVIPAIQALRDTLTERAGALADVVKIGRTHLMDAVPLTLGQEIGGWASQLDHGLVHLKSALPHVAELAIGGTAVGTGLNTHPELGERVVKKLSGWVASEFTSASNKFEALSAHDALVFAHGALKSLAVALIKIANDVRWLASGPRAGFGEIQIPANEPGSSIMPGKVNPTQSEALIMACTQVLGNDVSVNIAGASGNFQLNVQKPLLIFAFLQSARLIADGAASFREHCAAGIDANRERIRTHLEQSLMLVTALAPHVGYDNAAKIAKHAHANGTTLREAATSLGLVSAEDFDRWVRPEKMLSGA